MGYERPTCSLNQLDKICKIGFASDAPLQLWAEAIETLSRWRSAHRYPLNSFNMTLRNRALSVDKDAVVAQRLKRLDSVVRKLSRRQTMQMSQMQDVGGCRAVVGGMRNLSALQKLYQSRPLAHSLIKVDDYVSSPKDDGYRSLHFRYRFRGRSVSTPWDGLRIEVQLRTKLQHSWGTAVETIDAFTGQNVKFGDGSAEWRRFFALMGSVHAHNERQSFIPGTPTSIQELRDEVSHLEARLRVTYLLRSYAQISQHIEGRTSGKAYWYLLELIPADNRIRLRGFPNQLHATAQLAYAEAERRFADTQNQAVLVSVNSIKDLKKAYPNYFGDTRLFVSTLERFIGR